MLRDIKVKDEYNGNPLKKVPCYFMAKSLTAIPAGMFILVGGLCLGLPLGFFVPQIPYFGAANWIQAECTATSVPVISKQCGKSGCSYIGTVHVTYNTVDGTNVPDALFYSSFNNIANQYYSDVEGWALTMQPGNSSICYYNPKYLSELTDSRTVPWYLYLYAVLIGPFILIGGCIGLTGLFALLRIAGVEAIHVILDHVPESLRHHGHDDRNDELKEMGSAQSLSTVQKPSLYTPPVAPLEPGIVAAPLPSQTLDISLDGSVDTRVDASVDASGDDSSTTSESRG